jgi:hypothetical protein
LRKSGEDVLKKDFALKQENEIWQTKKLFDFSIPACLILNTSDLKLYESILPLLPKYYNGIIYYSSCYEQENNSGQENNQEKLSLDIFSYDINTGKIEKKSQAKMGQLFFSPILVENKIFYGGKLSSDNSKPCSSTNNNIQKNNA